MSGQLRKVTHRKSKYNKHSKHKRAYSAGGKKRTHKHKKMSGGLIVF